MPSREPITVSNIGDICREFGFGYESCEGKHFAAIDGKEVEVKFQPDGNLPRGRHAFIMAARDASEEFRTAYPPSSRKKVESDRQVDGNAGDRPALGKRFLKRYSIPDLEEAVTLIGEVISEKREAEEVSRKIREYEQELKENNQLADQIRKGGYDPHNQISERISEIESALSELRER